MAKSPKASKRNIILERRFRRNLFLVSLTALVIKLFIIFRIQGFAWYESGNGDLAKGLGELLDNNYVPPNAWYGADGENYIRGLQGLVKDGFFSREGKLSYWPAGYPLLLWPIAEVFRGYFFMALAVIQSTLYAAGTIWFVDELRKTRLAKTSYLVAFLLAFNPTLSLNTISVGYELPVVALSLISISALMHFFNNQKTRIISIEVLVASLAFSLSTFMQPRLLLIALAFFILWALAKYRLKVIAPFLALTLGLVVLAPAVLVFRNIEAQGYSAISTNLGVTMRLGAGPNTSGGYSNQSSGTVECPEVKGNPAEIDNQVVRCVIDWYLSNPSKAIVLFWNKARFFFSPWFGPEANGTMARNPWNQNHPLKSTTQTESGYSLIYGLFGKLISWLWILAGLFLIFFGFFVLWRLGDLERLMAAFAGCNILITLITSMLTIGDHRFRIPSMAMSVFLQAVALFVIFRGRINFQSLAEPLLIWPSLKRPKENI